MKPANLLFILSDQHNRDLLGCYGNPVVQTPNLDRLARAGTRFSAAYTTCPICVPARASLMTGRYVHETGHWDNAFPYDGTPEGWGHRLKAQDIHIDSIGKLHFRGLHDDNGFTTEIDPLHVVDGTGDLLSCVRDSPPRRDKRPGLEGAGPGNSTYLRYDASNAENAILWLQEHANDEEPWVLFLSFVCPHPPYIAPPELYEQYAAADLPVMPQHDSDQWPDHPALNYFRHFFTLDEPLSDEIWQRMNAAYYGVTTYLDGQIGRVLDTLSANKLTESTRVIYTSDHGESMGARGLSGKFTMYEEAAAIPLILAGPNVPAGKTVATPASFVDFFPTVLDAVGATPATEDADLPGESLWALANEPERERSVFSEYHAVGSRSASYMLRNRHYKYIRYVDGPPQLFDLTTDPGEERDLAQSAEHRVVLQQLVAELNALLDPVATDAHAKADQQAKIMEHGGLDAVLARGTFTNSPTPDETPQFERYDT